MKNIKEAIRNIVKEESEYQTFFKKALEKSGKPISQMSDDEKKAFFNKIDAAWDGKGEKNEELVGNQHKLDVDGDGEIEASDLAALRAGKKKDESINKGNIVEKKFSSKYDIGMGTMGNGTTIWNRAKEVRGDYETIAHVSNSGEVKFYDKSLPSDVKKYIEDYAKTQKESKLTESQLNENFSPSDVQKIKKAVQDSATFMQIGRGLQKLGFKYSFGTSPYPIYMIKKGTKTYVLINKKYADNPEFVIGDTAGGLLEGFIKATKESVTESKFKKGDKVTVKYPTLTKPLNGVVSTVLKGPDGDIVVLKGNNGVWDVKHVTLNEGKDVKASDIKVGNKISISDKYNSSGLNTPFVVKSIDKKDGYVIFKGNTGKEVLKVKETSPVALHEGNAFGAAVTAAKKEGKKEFEFNGKKYKVKKGSYEKNEAAKKVNEAIDVKYWKAESIEIGK